MSKKDDPDRGKRFVPLENPWVEGDGVDGIDAESLHPTDDILADFLKEGPIENREVRVPAAELRRLRAVDAWASRAQKLVRRLRYVPAAFRQLASLIEELLAGDGEP